MKYPTKEQVESADREQLCRWHRFLRSAETEEELTLSNRMFDRWKEAGGFNPKRD